MPFLASLPSLYLLPLITLPNSKLGLLLAPCVQYEPALQPMVDWTREGELLSQSESLPQEFGDWLGWVGVEWGCCGGGGRDRERKRQRG